MEYEVVWKIEVEAESCEGAAKIARKIQHDPDSQATHFVVRCELGEEQEVWVEDPHD